MNWIKCSEQMPPVNTEVLVWSPWNEGRDLLAYTGSETPSRRWLSHMSSNYQSAEYGNSITHWMPLPDPPSTGNTGE